LTDYIATRWYRPPEIVLGSTNYSKAVDMWALGCLIGELLTGKPLLPGTSTINQLERIIAAVGFPTPQDLESMKSKFSDSVLNNIPATQPKPLRQTLAAFNKDAVDLIARLLAFNPEKRLTCEQAMRHPYVACFCSDEELQPDPAGIEAITVPLPDFERFTVDEYRDALHKDIVRRKKEVKKKKREKRALREARAAAKASAGGASAADGGDEFYEDDFPEDDYPPSV